MVLFKMKPPPIRGRGGEEGPEGWRGGGGREEGEGKR